MKTTTWIGLPSSGFNFPNHKDPRIARSPANNCSVCWSGSRKSWRDAMIEAVPHLGDIELLSGATWGTFGQAGEMDEMPFASPVQNYYHTNPIARASQTMARCIEELMPAQEAAAGQKVTGTDG